MSDEYEFMEASDLFPDRPMPTMASTRMVEIATEAYMQAVNPYRNDDRALKKQSAPRDFRIEAAIEAVLKSEHLHWDEPTETVPTFVVDVTGEGMITQSKAVTSGDSYQIDLRGAVEAAGGVEIKTVPVTIRVRPVGRS